MSRDVLLFAIGWALVHSLWQCLLIGGALRAALALTRRAAAPVRYWLCCAALALMLGSLGATAWIAASGAHASSADATRTESPSVPPAAKGARARQALAEAPPLAALEPSVVALRGARAAWASARHEVETAFPFLVAAWALGVMVFSLRLGRAWLQVRRLVRNRVASPPAWLVAAAERLRRRIGISRTVRLLTSALVQVPTVVGWLRPVVLLPASALTGLTPRQIELLILHELVHVRRHDQLVNLLQAAAEVALFYHPAAWWVSARIREEREHCCDDAVAALEGVRDYVEALATMEEVRARRPVLALAADGSPLLARVVRLVDTRPAAANPAPRLAVGGALLVVAALLFFPTGGASAAVQSPAVARTPSPETAAPGGCTTDHPASTLCPALVRAAGDALAARRDGGVVIVQEVATGAVLVNSAAGADPAGTAAPGSVWKLVLAGIWWDQGLGEDAVRCTSTLRAGGQTVRNSTPPSMAVGGGVHGMLVGSCNTAAVRMALALRDRLGVDGFARELRRIGFPVAGGGEAAAGARDDAFWAAPSAGARAPVSPRRPDVRLAGDSSAWAGVGLGTERVQVTPLHVSRFMQAIGNGGLMLAPTVERAAAARPALPRRVLGAETASRLQAAMLDVVRRGTAKGADRALEGTAWHLGGKTGTSPHPGDEADGWFVGLVFDRSGAARYSVVVYLPRAGNGGGAPAHLAARLAAQLPPTR
jgi:beta-lactamase regulating signal transducer with metallopeptidase domain